jgi:hypothetical protein
MQRHLWHLALAVLPGLLLVVAGMLLNGDRGLLAAGSLAASGGLLAGLVLRYLGRGGITGLTGGLMAGFAIRLGTVAALFLIVRQLDGAAVALVAGATALAVGAVADAALLANQMRHAPLAAVAEVNGG